MTDQPKDQIQYFTGIVKQVQDGGFITVRGQPRNGPPPERTIALSEIDAPKMARRPTPNNKNPTPATDEPCAWESREFLRTQLVGKTVLCNVSHTTDTGREYGWIGLGSNNPEEAESIAKKLVSEGLAKVRDNCRDTELQEVQEAAKTAEKGIWAPDAGKHVREVIWEVDPPRQLVDRMKGKPVSAIIENVRDGSTVRAFLLPDYHHITLMMSGVKAPKVVTGRDGKPANDGTAEPFGLEAHYFTETRLLQREVQIILESVNNTNYVGSIVHPNGNIAEALLREGLAKCVDWSLACVTGGGEKYRTASAEAKQKKLKLWKDFVSSGPVIPAKDKEFTGKVVEIVNGDAIMVKKSKTDTRKIHLASIRPPRLAEDRGDRPKGSGPTQFRPLYDIPFMFEAREFLRKKLIGQNVQITVDYIQEASNDFPEKTCCTVTIGGANVAEALVSKGLATCVRYSADNDQRSSKYDDLLAAEDKAQKSNKGMHGKKDQTSRRIADVSGDVAKSKQFLPFLQRAGRMQAVVEFIASASRYRLYIPRETCVITFLLSGVSCPRGDRKMPTGFQEGEPFGNEASAFVKDQIMQKEVEIEVETMDKGGNFIGWCFDGINNISVQLIEEGFASAFVMGDRSNYGSQIQIAEDSAKRRKVRRWANYSEEEAATKEIGKVDEDKEKKENEEDRKVNYTKVVVTEVTQEAKIYAQHVDEGPKLEALMKQIRDEFSNNPPLAGAYQPKKGELCAAKFVDGQWYRAKVEKSSGSEVSVLYIDYGNRATIPKANCGTLPGNFVSLPAFAHEYTLALCNLCSDEDYAEQGLKAMREDLLDKELKLNVEYRVTGQEFASILDSNGEDIGKNLILDGLMLAEKKGGRKLMKLVDSYRDAMESAKKNHLNIWEYGDITADDAREFGVGVKR